MKSIIAYPFAIFLFLKDRLSNWFGDAIGQGAVIHTNWNAAWHGRKHSDDSD